MAAGEAPSIFNKRASEKLRSPDDLDKYVRVTNPSVWVVLAACLALLMGILAWGIFGTVSTNVSTTGTVAQGSALCVVPPSDALRIHEGDMATLGGVPVRVSKVETTIYSRDEVLQSLGADYLTTTLMKGDWGRVVYFEGDFTSLDEYVPYDVTISTERVAPITLVLGGQS